MGLGVSGGEGDVESSPDYGSGGGFLLDRIDEPIRASVLIASRR